MTAFNQKFIFFHHLFQTMKQLFCLFHLLLIYFGFLFYEIFLVDLQGQLIECLELFLNNFFILLIFQTFINGKSIIRVEKRITDLVDNIFAKNVD